MATKPEEGNDEFSAGFAGDDTPLTTTPEVPTEPVVAEPEYAKITTEEYERLKGIANSFEENRTENKRQLDTAFGKIGGLQQALTSLQTATPAGQVVEVSEDDFEELRAEFPELAKMQVAGLNRAMAKLKGTGGKPADAAPVAEAFDPERMKQIVGENTASIAEDIERKVEMRLVAKDHKDWREVTASEGYSTWLNAQGAEYAQKVLDSWDSDTVSESVTNYKAAQKKAETPAAPAKANRFAAAVTPKGDGGMAEGESEDDQFMAGFRSR